MSQGHQETLYEFFIISLSSMRQRLRKDKLKERIGQIEKIIGPGNAILQKGVTQAANR
jgi:hypothetical protein